MTGVQVEGIEVTWLDSASDPASEGECGGMAGHGRLVSEAEHPARA